MLVSCFRNEAILAQVVEFDTFTLSAQEPLGWSEVVGGVDGGGGFLFRDGVLGGGGVGFLCGGKVGFSLGRSWGGVWGFLVLLVLNRTTYLKISKIQRWSEKLWLRHHRSLSLKNFGFWILEFSCLSRSYPLGNPNLQPLWDSVPFHP